MCNVLSTPYKGYDFGQNKEYCTLIVKTVMANLSGYKIL